MNTLARGEFLLLMIAGGLFTLAAMHFTGHFDFQDARHAINGFFS